eukprot:COSAG06_NODE_1248_length_10110_cov_19.070223_12_plen_87_part_00
MLSGREREEGHAFSLPPAPRQGPQAAATGARWGRVKPPRPLAAGCGPWAPSAARAAGAAIKHAQRVTLDVVTEMRTCFQSPNAGQY